MEAFKNICVWYGECSCPRRWKQPFILDRIIWQTWRFTRTRPSKRLSLFNITEKLIRNLNVKPLESSSLAWTRSVLPHDEASAQVDKSKSTCLLRFSLCVRQMNESKEAITGWEGHVEKFKMYPSYKEPLGLGGEAIEVEWNIFSGFSSLLILQEIQQVLKRKSIEPEKLTDRIIFMSLFNGIDWTKKANDEILCFGCRNSQGLRDEILARTLDVSGSWIGREVVWGILVPSRWEVGLRSQ